MYSVAFIHPNERSYHDPCQTPFGCAQFHQVSFANEYWRRSVAFLVDRDVSWDLIIVIELELFPLFSVIIWIIILAGVCRYVPLLL